VRRQLGYLVVLLALVPLAQCGGGGSEREQARGGALPVDEAYQIAEEKFQAAQTDQEKAALAREFLESYPESEHTASILGAFIYYQGEALDDPERALALAESTLTRVQDPELAFSIRRQLLGLYGTLGRKEPLQETVAAMQAFRELSFSDHLDVMEAADDAALWDLALAHARQALTLATAEQYQQDYAEREISPQQAERAARIRRATARAHEGWALYHLGRTDEALAAFAAGEPDTVSNYVGVPESPLFIFWGQVLLAEGQHAEAMQRLAADAVMGGDPTAGKALAKAYADINGGDEGYDDFLWQERQRLARRVGGFQLQTFAGEPFDLSSQQGKVILLAFWFPT
jgi:hypothetical protein